MSLKSKTETKNNDKLLKSTDKDLNDLKKKNDFKNNETINQIKNITQEKNSKPELKKHKIEAKKFINTFEDLINTCIEYKEIKLKYELEKNVNLVRFENNRIEISFNDNLDKNFVKDLSLKLFEWTGERWIITFSKLKGEQSIKEKKKNMKRQIIEDEKKTNLYKEVLKNFPDANLINVYDDGKE